MKMRRRLSYRLAHRLCSMAVMTGLAAMSLTACGDYSEAVNDNGGFISDGSGAAGEDAAGNGNSGSGAGNEGNGSSAGNGGAGNDGGGSGAGNGDTGNEGSGGAGNEDGGNGATGNEGGTVYGRQDSVMAANAAAVDIISTEDMFTDRDLRGDYTEAESVKIVLSGSSAQCGSKAVQISGGTITIVEEGTYLLSGTLQEGMVVIAAGDKDKVQLVFDNVNIFNSSNAAVYVKSADKVFFTLAAGSANVLENGGSYTALDENNIDGVIFAKSDLTINGSGSLEVTAASGHGIVSKDDLKMTGGSLAITASGHGMTGKDSVRIGGGSVSIIAGKDGIRSQHDTNEEKGYIYIADGSFTVTAEGDGISAGKTLQIDGGKFVIAAGGGSGSKTAAKDENGEIVSAKGIKAAGAIVINNGDFNIDSQDDALHSNESIAVNGGVYQIASGDDGVHADETAAIAGGSIDISTSYEGIEGNEVVISGGYIKLYASDDGINAAGGNDQSGFGGMFGRDNFGSGSDSSLLISGGTIYVNADGDGLDSNGTLTVTGGEVYISGPVNGANGALDYDGVGQITGGIVAAAGSSGMAMNFGDTSTQGSILITTASQPAGAEIIVKDDAGKELISYTAESAFNSVVVSCPEMVQGGTYTILAGDSEQTVTLENLIYGGGFGPGMGGGWGGRGSWNGQDNRDGQNGRSGRGEAIPDGKEGWPEKGQMPDMSGMPEGGRMPDMSGMPEGGQMPDMSQTPNENRQSEKGQAPEENQIQNRS